MKPWFSLLFCMVVVEGTTVQKALHDGNTQFTTRFFSEILKKNRNKSVVLSAFSVITPLSQLAAASEGATHDELINAVGFPNNVLVKDIFALINEKFTSIDGIELKTASKFYIRQSYEVQDKFAAESKNIYHSEIAKIDFSDSKKSAKQINTWVENETNHRIKDLVDSSTISSTTRGILVNAVYFKGAWEYPFTDEPTKKQNFYVNKEETLQILTMHNTQDYFYKESRRLKSKILELPYVGDQSSFLVVLPDEVEGIGQLLEDLKNPNILDEETKDMSNVEVRVSIPKFKIETKTDLKEVLENMNVTKIFGVSANLNKLLKSDEKLFVSDAVQKAFIEVNEQGAEAAAANAFYKVGAAFMPVPRPSFDFVADHPFVFFLKVHNEIIFNGVYYGS